MPTALRWMLTLIPLNPIAVRLVQNGSRRKRHLYIRSAYLGILIVVLLALLLQAGGPGGDQTFAALAQAGAGAFEVVAYLQLMLICILTPVFMAGAITQESNPKTWDTLLTTPLSAPQIVLGNLAGRLVFVLALLLASLPLFAVTQYFGGVPARSVLLSYLVSAGAAVAVGAIAIALAVNRLAGRRGVFAFYTSVITYLGATAAIDAALQSSSPAGPGGVTVLTPLNPFLALRALIEPSGYPTPGPLELQALGPIARIWYANPVAIWSTITLGGSLLIALTCSLTIRAINAQSTPVMRRLTGSRAARVARNPREVWNNPIAWWEATSRTGTPARAMLRWAFVAIGILFGVALTVAYHSGGLTAQTYQTALLGTLLTEIAVLALVTINLSATAISREREDGTLDLLLTTPISQKYYINGKLRGLLSFLLPLIAVPSATAAAAGIYAFIEGPLQAPLSATTGQQIGIPIVLPEIALLVPLSAIPFIALCAIIGLNVSLRSKGSLGAVTAAVAIVGAFAATLGICGLQSAASLSHAGPTIAGLTPGAMIYALVEPRTAMDTTITEAGLSTARTALAIGVVISLFASAGIIAAVRAAMIKTFDTSTRKLAGRR